MNEFHINDKDIYTECLEISNIIYKYSCDLADARKEVDTLKNELEIATADNYLKIYKDPSVFIEYIGIMPPGKGLTEAGKREVVRCLPIIQKLSLDIAKKKHDVNLMQGALRALDVKNENLGRLIKMIDLQIYGNPRLPTDVKIKVKKDNKKAIEVKR